MAVQAQESGGAAGSARYAGEYVRKVRSGERSWQKQVPVGRTAIGAAGQDGKSACAFCPIKEPLIISFSTAVRDEYCGI